MKHFHAIALLLTALLLSTQAVAGVVSTLWPQSMSVSVELPAQNGHQQAVQHSGKDCHEEPSSSSTASQHCQDQCSCCYSGCGSASALPSAVLAHTERLASLLQLDVSQHFSTAERERLLRPPIDHRLL